MPVIASVHAAGERHIRVRWETDAPRKSTEAIDLSPLLNAFKFYRPLRGNDRLFRTVHVAEDGNAIAWGDGSIDMSATSIERLAEEAMTAAEFRDFLRANGLTHAEAAAILGRSRRQIENYLGAGPIPRIVVLACYGYLARKHSVRAALGAVPRRVRKRPAAAIRKAAGTRASPRKSRTRRTR